MAKADPRAPIRTNYNPAEVSCLKLLLGLVAGLRLIGYRLHEELRPFVRRVPILANVFFFFYLSGLSNEGFFSAFQTPQLRT